MEQGLVLEKDGGKENLFEILGFGYSKVIFALLNKSVTVYIKLTLIHVWYLSFKKSL